MTQTLEKSVVPKHRSASLYTLAILLQFELLEGGFEYFENALLNFLHAAESDQSKELLPAASQLLEDYYSKNQAAAQAFYINRFLASPECFERVSS
jgi:hypothetical protein